MAAFTQEQIEDLKSEVLSLASPEKAAELETDIKSKANYSLDVQGRFLTRVRDAFEATQVDKYLDKPAAQTNGAGGNRRPEKSNPWSKEGWNVSAQGRLVTAIGEAKAAKIADAAGCKIGSTKPNPAYN
jgi:hypothetical protein